MAVQILGPDGNPLPKTPPKAIEPIMRATRSSRVSDGLTPDQLAQILAEAEMGNMTRQMELFEEMEEKDTYLSQQLQVRKNAVIGADWEVQPFDDSSEAIKLAEEVKAWIGNLDLEDLMFDTLDAIGKGVSVVSLAWEYDGKIQTLAAYEWIHQRNLQWDITKGEFQIRTVDGISDIPYGGAIFHKFKARSGSANRAGLLRGLSWLYLFKNYGIKDWVSFLETYGSPIILGKYDTDDKDGRRALIEAVLSIASEAMGVISKSTEIEIIEANKTSSADAYKAMVELMEKEMAIAVLGTSMTSLDGRSGSKGMAATLNEVRIDLRKSDAKALARTLRRDLIIPFCHFNFDRADLAPSLVPQIAEPEDLKVLSDNIKTLTDAGLKVPVQWIYKKFGIPAPEGDEETLGTGKPNPLAASKRRLASGDNPEQAKGFVDGAMYADGVAETGAKRAAAILESDLGRVLEAVATSPDYPTLRSRLVDLYKDLDSTALAELMQRSMMMANLGGRAAVQDDL